MQYLYPPTAPYLLQLATIWFKKKFYKQKKFFTGFVGGWESKKVFLGSRIFRETVLTPEAVPYGK